MENAQEVNWEGNAYNLHQGEWTWVLQYGQSHHTVFFFITAAAIHNDIFSSILNQFYSVLFISSIMTTI